MGNQQGHNCFSPRTPKSSQNSEIIQKKKIKAFGNQKDSQRYLQVPVKIKNSSYPVSSCVKNNDGSIRIKIQINLKGNAKQIQESQGVFNRIPIKIQLHSPPQQNYATSHQHQTEKILKQSLQTMPQEDAINILELDLPETTTRRGSCQFDTQ